MTYSNIPARGKGWTRIRLDRLARSMSIYARWTNQMSTRHPFLRLLAAGFAALALAAGAYAQGAPAEKPAAAPKKKAARKPRAKKAE